MYLLGAERLEWRHLRSREEGGMRFQRRQERRRWHQEVQLFPRKGDHDDSVRFRDGCESSGQMASMF